MILSEFKILPLVSLFITSDRYKVKITEELLEAFKEKLKFEKNNPESNNFSSQNLKLIDKKNNKECYSYFLYRADFLRLMQFNEMI